MAWQTAVSVLFALASAVCQVFALTSVRVRVVGTGTSLARRLQLKWSRLVARVTGKRPDVHGAVGSARGATSWVGSGDGYSPPSEPIASQMASYIAHVERQFDRLREDAKGQDARLIDIEATVKGLTEESERDEEEARLAVGWIFYGSALAVLAAVVQFLP